MWCRFYLILITMLFGRPIAAQESDPETEFRHAVTWYRVARATENSYHAHEQAQTLYQQILASPTTSATLKEKAQLGLDQVVFRLDNAHDTYRTLFEPVWWMTKSDSTVEWYGDPYMLALGNAYAAMEAHWEREIDPENHAVIALVSRDSAMQHRVLDTDGTTDMNEEIEYRLLLMRDELIGLADSTPAIVGVPDDLFPTSIAWTENPTLTAEQVRAVAKAVGTQGVVVVRAKIDDEIHPTDDNLGIVRVSLSTDFWRVTDNIPYATLKSVGIGQFAAPRKPAGFLWVGMIFILSLVGAQLYARKSTHTTAVTWLRGSLVGMLTFLIGGFWVNIALTFAADYQIDWGQASFWIEDFWMGFPIPYIPSFQWIVIFGFVALAGPLLLLVWAQSKAAVLLQAFVPEKSAQIPLFLPMMSAGVLGWMFLPMVIADPAYGFVRALPMALLTQGVIFVTMPSFIRVLDGIGDASFHLTNVAVGIIALGLLFSLGLYNDYEWISLGFALPVVAWIRFRGEPEMDIPESQAIVDENSENPFEQICLIEKEASIVTEIIVAIEKEQSVMIRREEGITAGRIFQNLLKQPRRDRQKIIHIECSSIDHEPFVLINRLFELLGMRAHSSGGEGDNLLADGVDSILTGLPGVEFVMGLIDNTGNSDMTREVMIQDTADFLTQHLNTKVSLVVCIENAHWMDSASQEVFLTVMNVVDPSMFLVVWDSSAEDDIAINQLRDQEPAIIHETAMLTYEESDVRSFALQYNVKLSEELYQSMIRQVFALSERNIQKVQGLFAHLFAKDHLKQTVDNTIVASESLTGGTLKNILPDNYRTVEQEKLKVFTDHQRTILKLASACGDVFYAAELAAGLNVSKLDILQDLMLIEQAMTPAIIIDVPNARNIFQFRLSLTQQVFEDYLYYNTDIENGKPVPNELAHHYFEQIVQAGLRGDIREVPVARLIEHAERIGQSATQSLLTLMVRHFKHLKSMCALDDIIQTYQTYRPRFQSFASTYEVVQLDVMYADAVKKTDAEQGKNRAIKVLNNTREMMRYLSEEQVFDFVKDWCDIGYSGVDDKELLGEWKRQVKAELTILPDISKWYAESYILTADRYLQSQQIGSELMNLVTALRAHPVSNEQQYALGRILKEAASAIWKEWFGKEEQPSLEEQRSLFNQKIQPMLVEAVEIMRRQNDFVGVAIAYGQEALIHLFQIKQYPQAVDLLTKDLEIVLEYHQLGVESVTYNRLSMAYLNLWKEKWVKLDGLDSEVVMTTWREAHHNVLQSLSVAKQRKRTKDIIFSLNHLTDVLMAREVWRHSNLQDEQFSSFQEAAEALNLSWDVVLDDLHEISAEVLAIDWEIIPHPGFRNSVQQRWKEICIDCSGVEWVQALAKRLN